MKSKIFRVVTALVTASMLISAAGTPAAVAQGTVQVNSKNSVTIDFERSSVDRYAVLLKGDSLVEHMSSIYGNENFTSSMIDQNSAYLDEVNAQIDGGISTISSALNRNLNIRYRYDVILNGFSADMTFEEAQLVATLPGVEKILAINPETLDTDAGPEWINADEVWDSSAVPEDSVGTKGEGMIVGIIDTGINFDHPSFADPGPVDGYNYPTPEKYFGVCDPTSSSYKAAYASSCTDKLIGAYDLLGKEVVSPEDDAGHGTHTASTVAGNTLNISYYGSNVTISGVAPHAQIIAYDVCEYFPATGGSSCWPDATAAAVDLAITQGVDVINFSISGGTKPFSDLAELAFLDAFDAGIFVAASAGNQESEPTTDGYVNHLGPWVMTVAASTHNRYFENSISGFNGSLSGSVFTGAGTSASFTGEVVYAGTSGNALCAPAYSAWTATTFTGKIVLCDRGVNTFVSKIAAVKAAGASGIVIANAVNSSGLPTIDFAELPGILVDYTDGAAIKAWIAEGGTPTATLDGISRHIDDAAGDIKADFSFRGPGVNDFEVLKPEITAPGVAILAGVADTTIAPSATAEFETYNGTSMASPHVAGAATLIKALHPTWSPAEIKSALMLSGKTTGLKKEDGSTAADKFDFGAGRVDVAAASRAGLVMDMTVTDIVTSYYSDSESQLNLPSFQANYCVASCSWTRTFTNVSGVAVTYALTDKPTWVSIKYPDNPSEVTTIPFDVGESVDLVFTVDASPLALGEWSFGGITLETSDTFLSSEPISAVNIPLAVRAMGSTLPLLYRDTIYNDQAHLSIPDVTTVAYTDFSYVAMGLVKSTPRTFYLAQDPTNSAPLDDLNQVYFNSFTVPSDTKRLVVEITKTTSNDIDMFFGLDNDGNGIPSAADDIFEVATSAVLEYATQVDPTPGNYWIVVQNWDAHNYKDFVELNIATVSTADEGNLIINAPSTASSGESIDVTFDIDEDARAGDSLYGYILFGRTPETVGDLGVMQFDLYRGDTELRLPIISK